MNREYREEGYKSLLVICIVFSIVLGFRNFFESKEMIKKQEKLKTVEEMRRNKNISSKSIEHSDIIKFIQGKEGINTIKLNDKKDSNIIDVEIENNWDIIKTIDVFKNIKTEENFACIRNLLIEENSENKIRTKINMEFVNK